MAPPRTGTLALDGTALTETRRPAYPFGNPRGNQPTMWAGDHGYVGGTKDDATGLTNLGAREYQPTTGRFLSPAPLIDLASPQQWNAYAYSNNTPVNLSDPTSLHPDGSVGGFGNVLPDGTKETWTPDGEGGWTYGRDFVFQQPGEDGVVIHQVLNFNANPNKHRSPVESSWTPFKAKGNPIWTKIAHLAAEFTGVADAVDCVHGSVWGCVSTSLNVIGYNKVKMAERGLKTLLEEATADEPQSPRTPVGCKTNSFPHDTPVLLADGTTKPIGEVQPGDKVIATDTETSTTGPEPVTHTILTPDDRDFTDLTLADPSAPAKTSTITSTQKPPYWDETTHRWTNANDLRSGDQLLTPDGKTVSVLQVRSYHTNPQPAYNLTIGNLHTYYVVTGASPVLVHNDSGWQVPDDYIIIRGGQSPMPGAGVEFSGSMGTTLNEAGAGVPHGSLRATTAGAIRAAGGTVEYAPEPIAGEGSALNYNHLNVKLGSGDSFGAIEANPVPKAGRLTPNALGAPRC